MDALDAHGSANATLLMVDVLQSLGAIVRLLEATVNGFLLFVGENETIAKDIGNVLESLSLGLSAHINFLSPSDSMDMGKLTSGKMKKMMTMQREVVRTKTK